MDSIIVTGGSRLAGSVKTSGAKNAALPVLFASLLADGEHTFERVPNLRDIDSTDLLLEALGCEIERSEGRLVVRVAKPDETVAPYDLVHYLKAMGAQIEGEGSSTITVQGVDRLHGVTHPVVADRIELGTYMLAPAITGGTVECIGGRIDLVRSFAEKLDEAGIAVEETANGLSVSRKNGRVSAVDVETAPFPGFPTDLQAQMMALLCTAEGTSVLEERIFENRFMHAPELSRLGADITVRGQEAIVKGVPQLTAAPCMATDLRASVSLVIAGLAAEGETVVNRIYHLDRGFERLEEKLTACGAQIERRSEEEE